MTSCSASLLRSSCLLYTSYIEWYKNKLISILNEIYETQAQEIDRAAQLMADTALAGKSIYAFGPSHAGMMVEEMVYRGGGLALVSPIHIPNPVSYTHLAYPSFHSSPACPCVQCRP